MKQSKSSKKKIMKTINLIMIIMATSIIATGQNTNVDINISDVKYKKATNLEKFAGTITVEDLTKHLTVIASDEMEGRETGQEGQQKAAIYIEDQFKALGLPPIVNGDSYQQKISFIAESWKKINLTVNDKKFRHLWEFYAFPSTNSDRELSTKEEVVFLGYGIDDPKYSDYKKADVKDKVILIYAGEPVNKKGISKLTGTTELSDWSSDWRKKLNVAKQKGVHTVLIIDPEIKKNIDENRRFLLSPRMHMGESENAEENYANNYFISSEIAKEIVGDRYKKFIKKRDKMKRKGKSKSMDLTANLSMLQQKNVKTLIGSNVLGFIEGTDEKLKDEVIVVTAHYDHLGKRGESIYNGADDNGSGTSTVLEVAEALTKAKEAGIGPRRSVLTMLVSGEEKGLLGSEYYAEHPVFPLASTVANVNVDMVGRVDEKHKENPEYIYVIGSDRLSTELHDINETANKTYTKLELDYTYNAENDPNRYYYRSDHYNFAQKGIPAIFYFNGTHADYHRTSDTIDKINFDKMAKIGQLVFYTTWELANREERIKVDVEEKN